MTTYVDTSALLKRYVDEPDSDRAAELLGTALRLGTAMTFLTFDVRQAHAARALGFPVAGL